MQKAYQRLEKLRAIYPENIRIAEIMRNMTMDERRQHITSLSNERKEYLHIIESLIDERKEYILEHTSNSDTSFDKEVINAIKTLASKKGLYFK